MAEETSKKDSAIGLESNVEGLLCYALGFVTGVIFLLISKDKFVRFHAVQSIVVFLGLFIIQIVGGVIPVLNSIILPIVTVAGLILWIVLMVKAYQGEKFKLPIAGDIAEKNSQ